MIDGRFSGSFDVLARLLTALGTANVQNLDTVARTMNTEDLKAFGALLGKAEEMAAKAEPSARDLMNIAIEKIKKEVIIRWAQSPARS